MRLIVLGVAAAMLAACGTASSVSAQTMAANTSAVPAPAPAPTTNVYAAPPEQQLIDLERQLANTAQEHGLGGAYGSVIDPSDGFVLRPGETYRGTAAVERGLGTTNSAPIFWQPDKVVVSRSGDMGLTSGRYVQVVPGAEAIQGRYVAVWRKDASGEWKLLMETRQADPPRGRVRRSATRPAASAARH